MTNAHRPPLIENAARQDDRQFSALSPNHVRIDDRSLEDLLAFPAVFGRLVRFYDLDDTPQGDWSGFFRDDPSLVLAAMAAIDLDAARRVIRRQGDDGDEGERARRFDAILAGALDLARHIDVWLTGFGASARESATSRAMVEAISGEIEGGLAADLERLTAWRLGTNWRAERPGHVPLDGFNTVWRARDSGTPASEEDSRPPRRRRDRALTDLIDRFNALADAAQRLKERAARLFEPSLHESAHPPHAALYIAFAHLFRTAQDALNTIPARHVDFYHDVVLGLMPRPVVADQTYLVFTLPAEAGPVAIPRGVLCPAGKDASGRDVLYASDHGVLVTPTAIAKVGATRVVEGSLLADASGSPVGPVRHVQTWFRPMIPPQGGWPAFGAEAAGETDWGTATGLTPTTLLFSPILALAGGERRIQIDLTLPAPVPGEIGSLLDATAPGIGGDTLEVLADLLVRCVKVRASGQDGWFDAGPLSCVPLNGDGLRLSVSLSTAAPPVAPFETVHRWPGIQFELTTSPVRLYSASTASDVEIHPLIIMQRLSVSACKVTVEVAGLAGLVATGPDGVTGSDEPSLVFGAEPRRGAVLDLWHPELFSKALEGLRMDLVWARTPQTPTGFQSYYRGYEIDLGGARTPGLFDNRSFRVSLSVCNPGRWTLAPATERHLFRTGEGDATEAAAPVRDVTPFEDLPVLPAEPPAYYDPAASRLRVTLVDPPHGFGADLYLPNALAATEGTAGDGVLDVERSRAACEPLRSLQTPGGWVLKAATPRKGPFRNWRMGRAIDDCHHRLRVEAGARLFETFNRAAGRIPDEQAWETRASLDAAVLAGGRATARLPGLAAAWSRWLDWWWPFRRHAARRDVMSKRLRAWIDDNAVLLGAQAEPDLDVCRRLLEAAGCVDECDADARTRPPKGYVALMHACLTACAARLLEAHQDCLSASPGTGAPPVARQPNPPWVPIARSITVGYTAAASLTGTGAGSEAIVFHFGAPDGLRSAPGDAVGFPFWAPLAPGAALHIGLSNHDPRLPLSLLVIIAGAETPGSVSGPPTWERLTGSGWRPALPVADGTRGFTRTGVVAWEADAEGPPAGDLTWLRASFAGATGAGPRIVSIRPHAVLASGRDAEGKPAAPAVEAGRIKGLQRPIANLAVDQPLPAFGGRGPDHGSLRQTWISERLRHKNRAVLAWDYERLVLDAFPEVAAVKALPGRAVDGGPAPGRVIVIVLPGPSAGPQADPDAPVAPRDLLERIRAHLEAGAGAFTRIEVRSPTYVKVRIEAEVDFVDPEDGPALSARLQADLREALAASRTLGDGGTLATDDDAIAAFIHGRSYVRGLLSLGLVCTPPATADAWPTTAPDHGIRWVQGASPGSGPTWNEG